MSDTPKRRIRSERYAGIYYREGADGRRVYEISYTDSDGRRRWRSGFRTEKEAVRELANIRARLGRGERITKSARLAEVAPRWLEQQGNLRPRTRERYELALRVHVLPRLGRYRVSEITEDHVAHLIADMRAGGYYEQREDGTFVRKVRVDRTTKQPKPASGWGIRAVLTPLSRAMAFAVRRGMAAHNPVTKLERGERPSVGRREMRVLERDEIAKLLAHAGSDRYRVLLAVAIYTGLRLGELLGLTWADVDLNAGVVRVRYQLDRKTGGRVEPKTPQAKRDVVLMPALGKMLREHRLASVFSKDRAFVFASEAGTALAGGNVSKRALARAVKAAGLDGPDRPKLRFHDLRHGFASLLIEQGRDVVFVSRQLGHANPSITLSIYAHLFDARKHAEDARAQLEASFGGMLEQFVEQTPGSSRQDGLPEQGAKVVSLSGFGG